MIFLKLLFFFFFLLSVHYNVTVQSKNVIEIVIFIHHCNPTFSQKLQMWHFWVKWPVQGLAKNSISSRPGGAEMKLVVPSLSPSPFHLQNLFMPSCEICRASSGLQVYKAEAHLILLSDQLPHMLKSQPISIHRPVPTLSEILFYFEFFFFRTFNKYINLGWQLS